MAKTKKLAMLIIALALIVCSGLALTGCSSNDAERGDVPNVSEIPDSPDISEFEIIDCKLLLRGENYNRDVVQYIAYDPDTMVEYTFFYGTGQPTGLIVLLNADGTPKIYSPDEE